VSVGQIGPVYVPENAQPPEVIPAIPEPVEPAKSPEAPAQEVYAGFWLRAVAYVIDTVIISIPFGLVAGLYPSLFFPNFDPHAPIRFPLAQPAPLALAVVMVGFWLYSAAFESSSWQATPGKRILRLYVTDMHAHRVTFLRALGRNLAKQISGFVLIGYFLAGFTKKKQALHDIIASCLVLRRP